MFKKAKLFDSEKYIYECGKIKDLYPRIIDTGVCGRLSIFLKSENFLLKLKKLNLIPYR